MRINLADCRDLARLTVQDAAKALGISESTLLKYEEGKNSPQLEVGGRMSKIYGIPLENMDFRLSAQRA